MEWNEQGLGSMDATDEDFVQADGGLVNHLGFHGFRCLNELLSIPSADIGPLMATAAMLDRAENAGSFGKRLLESERDAAKRFLNRVEFALEKNAAFMKDRNTIGQSFDFVQQMGREEYGSPFIGDRLDNSGQNIAAHHRIEPRGGFVEDQQFRAMSERKEQANASRLSARQGPNPLLRIEIEHLPQLLRKTRVPLWEEAARVIHDLLNAHPVRNVPILRHVADAAQDIDRMRHRIEAEYSDRTGLGVVGTENVLDQRGFSSPVGTDQAKDAATRNMERHIMQRSLAAKGTAQIPDLNGLVIGY